MFRQSCIVVLGLALGLISAGCAAPDPIALVPLPPGVEYPWRTQTNAPTPAEFAAVRRARLVVINGVLGAGYYAERWESLPAFPPPLPSRSELLVVVEDMPEVALETRRQPDRRVAPAENDPAAAEEPVAASGPPTGQPGRRVNINSASSRELESLSGIGPSLASRIVEARPYRAVDDLLRVRGIGPSTLARFQGSVVVE